MSDATSLRGLTAISFRAADVEAAKDWYIELRGLEPYFVRPPAPAPATYVEFGDYQHELGIIDRRYAPPRGGDHAGAAPSCTGTWTT